MARFYFSSPWGAYAQLIFLVFLTVAAMELGRRAVFCGVLVAAAAAALLTVLRTSRAVHRFAAVVALFMERHREVCCC